MKAEPEISIRVLSHFRPSLLRAQSIMVARSDTKSADDPKADTEWRFPSENELSRTLDSSTGLSTPSRSIGIFNFPHHLRDAWREGAEAVATRGDHTGPEFQSFIERVAEFLRYKRVSLAEKTRFDVILARPSGVFVECGESERTKMPTLAINLGQESVDAIIANKRENPTSLDFAPLFRLTLESGDGLSFPPGTVVHFEHRNAKSDAILLLKISPDVVVASKPEKQRWSRSTSQALAKCLRLRTEPPQRIQH